MPKPKNNPPKTNLVSRRKIQIEWGDCDPAQIVYFPRYLEYFDACTNALFQKAGLRKDKMLKRYGILGIPLVDLRASFFAPSRLAEVVTVESEIVTWGRSSFVVRHRLFKRGVSKREIKEKHRKAVVAVECFETRVWAAVSADDPEKVESRAVPREVMEKFWVSGLFARNLSATDLSATSLPIKNKGRR